MIAGIAWIGSSFYFIALDNHLAPPADERDAARGVGGEVWEIHGGGFYRIEKFKVAPRDAARPALLVQVGGVHDLALRLRAARSSSTTRTPRPSWSTSRSPTSTTDRGDRCSRSPGSCSPGSSTTPLCRAARHATTSALAVVVAAFVVLAAWASSELFAPRAAYIEVGAMLGTIMAANVFFVIIPMHWKLVRAKEAGEEPDPALERPRQAAVGAQQLPHAAGRVRDALEPLHVHLRARARLADPRRADGARRARRATTSTSATAAGTPGGSSRSRRPGVVALAIAIRPASSASSAAGPPPTFAEVQAIVANRCAPCHSLHPTQPGYSRAARRDRARDAGADRRRGSADPDRSRSTRTAMPLGNATEMTQAERDTLARWLASR